MVYDDRKKIFFYTGLPRSGSTLLSSILTQNQNIHSEGNSPVCQLMWDIHVSVTQNCSEQFIASQRNSSEYVEFVIENYYKNIESKYIFDKCRSWGIEENIQLIQKYITSKPKFIVLIRPIIEILSSFINLYKLNNFSGVEAFDFLSQGEPILRSYNSVLNLIDNHFEDCLFIFYDDIVNDTSNTISKIYKFCNIEGNFSHSFTKIKNKFPENDLVYGLKEVHDVRPEISLRKYHVDIEDEYKKICEEMYFNLLKKYNEKSIHTS